MVGVDSDEADRKVCVFLMVLMWGWMVLMGLRSACCLCVGVCVNAGWLVFGVYVLMRGGWWLVCVLMRGGWCVC